MEIKILKKAEINKIVANKIAKLINKKSNAVLGLATGSTPIGVYKNLIKLNEKGKVSFRGVKTFNLDEYVGIDTNHAQSYKTFMNENLFNYIDINKLNTYFPDNQTATPEYYDKQIEASGGIDFQILGIGSNGHIAFNEPGTSFNSPTHIVDLTESTIKDNSRFFDSVDEVPTKAVSMGLKTIMKANEIVLIALGKNKAKAISKLLKDDINENLPASILKNHSNVTIYCDESAGSLI